ncbi:hypothetical protein QYF36_018363 [Acer negundo]|nr:hypothetical protein QYF36_018363 [Acer negundo]
MNVLNKEEGLVLLKRHAGLHGDLSPTTIKLAKEVVEEWKDHEIDMEELVRYGLGLGLYQNTDSIEEARSELNVMVNRLKASILLLDAKEGHVKMHDVDRDVALWITSKGENVFMVKAGMRLKELVAKAPWPGAVHTNILIGK